MTSRKFFACLLILFLGRTILSAYNGASFPVKYLLPEDVVPTTADVELYSAGLSRMLGWMTKETLNKTDPSQAISIFFMRAILKRTLQENGLKLQEKHRKTIKDLVNAGDNLMSHVFCTMRKRSWSDMLKRVIELFRDDTFQVRTLGKYNANQLTRWLLSNKNINSYAQRMDEAKLPKEVYVKLIQSARSSNHSLSMDISDYCLSQIIFNPIHWDMKMRRCTASKLCGRILYRHPSTTYITSHRMLNVVMPRQTRRCYMRTREKDYDLLNLLCASMYRETVYLARRGYFYRDIFMEHIALCSLLGYREFHRRHWFHKVTSWIDKNGCIQENMNFEINRTRYALVKTKSKKRYRNIRRRFRKISRDPCHLHQMSLGLVTLAHGIRYSVHFGGDQI